MCAESAIGFMQTIVCFGQGDKKCPPTLGYGVQPGGRYTFCTCLWIAFSSEMSPPPTGLRSQMARLCSPKPPLERAVSLPRFYTLPLHLLRLQQERLSFEWGEEEALFPGQLHFLLSYL